MLSYVLQPPVPIEKWNETLHAKSWAPRCSQTRGGPASRHVGNEDCLYLNIYTTVV